MIKDFLYIFFCPKLFFLLLCQQIYSPNTFIIIESKPERLIIYLTLRKYVVVDFFIEKNESNILGPSLYEFLSYFFVSILWVIYKLKLTAKTILTYTLGINLHVNQIVDKHHYLKRCLTQLRHKNESGC